jgi:hypothetical protein
MPAWAQADCHSHALPWGRHNVPINNSRGRSEDVRS